MGIARRVRQRRLELNLTQAALSLRADIKLPTYRKFERTGLISLGALLRIAFALDALDEFGRLFTRRQYATFEEAVAGAHKTRKRGKRND